MPLVSYFFKGKSDKVIDFFIQETQKKKKKKKKQIHASMLQGHIQAKTRLYP
jgi:hypothetical protein